MAGDITEDEDTFIPPPGPPPLLSDDQIVYLATQGHLPLHLPPPLSLAYSQLCTLIASNYFSKPTSEKRTIYPPYKSEEVGYKNILDEKEFLTIRSRVHPGTEVEVLIQRIWADTVAILRRVLGDLSRAAELPDEDGIWDGLLENSLQLPAQFDSATQSFIRLFQYLPSAGTADKHTDLGLLTLCVGQGQGLQVWVYSDGTAGSQAGWEDCEGPTLLIGDSLRKLLGYRVRSGGHRVVGNPDGRSSAVFALRPSLRHEVDMGTFGAEGGTVNMRDFWTELTTSKYNVNAPKHVREQQRADREKRLVQERRADQIH